MDHSINLDHFIKMIEIIVHDVSECENDLMTYEKDLFRIYPDYNKPNLTRQKREMIEDHKNKFLYFRRRNYVKTIFSSLEGILFGVKRFG